MWTGVETGVMPYSESTTTRAPSRSRVVEQGATTASISAAACGERGSSGRSAAGRSRGAGDRRGSASGCACAGRASAASAIQRLEAIDGRRAPEVEQGERAELRGELVVQLGGWV